MGNKDVKIFLTNKLDLELGRECIIGVDSSPISSDGDVKLTLSGFEFLDPGDRLRTEIADRGPFSLDTEMESRESSWLRVRESKSGPMLIGSR